jgi:hypothetical protein
MQQAGRCVMNLVLNFCRLLRCAQQSQNSEFNIEFNVAGRMTLRNSPVKLTPFRQSCGRRVNQTTRSFERCSAVGLGNVRLHKLASPFPTGAGQGASSRNHHTFCSQMETEKSTW